MAETSNPDSDEEYSLSGLDGTLQLGDTELDGVPATEILEKYTREDVNQIVYHGDASKKDVVSEEQYLEQLKQTYGDLNELGEQLDADVLVLPGNHAPIKGAHKNGEDAEYVENVERILEQEYEEFAEYEGNAYEFMVDSHDNLTDLTNTTYETEEGNSIVGMSDHFGPELDPQSYQLMDHDPELEELGYNREEVAEIIAENYSGDENTSSWKDKARWWLQPVGHTSEGSTGTVPDVDPEDITLDHIAELPEELRDEVMTEGHKQYQEMVEDLDIPEEELEQYEQQVQAVGERVRDAEGKVHVVHHSTPFDPERNKHGSVVLRDVIKNERDHIDVVSGGHGHTGGEGDQYELEGVPVVNAAQTFTGIGLGDEVHTEINGMDVEQPQRDQGQRDQEAAIKEIFEGVEEAGSPEEYYSEREQALENELDQAVEEGRITEEQREQQWERARQGLEQEREVVEQMWETGDYEKFLEEGK